MIAFFDAVSLASSLAAADTPLARIIVSSVATLFGVAFIIVGRRNVRTRVAEDSGARRAVARVVRGSPTYTGRTARAIGIMRIALGVFAIIFAILFLIFGPVLADKTPP